MYNVWIQAWSCWWHHFSNMKLVLFCLSLIFLASFFLFANSFGCTEKILTSMSFWSNWRSGVESKSRNRIRSCANANERTAVGEVKFPSYWSLTSGKHCAVYQKKYDSYFMFITKTEQDWLGQIKTRLSFIPRRRISQKLNNWFVVLSNIYVQYMCCQFPYTESVLHFFLLFYRT